MMLAASDRKQGLDVFRTQFAVSCLNRYQPAADEAFRCTAFIHLYMGRLCTNNSLMGHGHRSQSGYIGTGSVKNKEYFYILTKYFFKTFYGRFSIGIIPVSHNM